jgi:hypothetical protein
LKHLLAAITASSHLEYDATSLAHLYLESFSHSSFQILSSSVRLDGERRWDGDRFSPDMMLGIQSKEFNLDFIRPENLVYHYLRVF